MPLTEEQKIEIKEKIIDTIRNKFQSYQPETTKMPFHYRLLGRDRMALFSFIHSLNTTFGTSIFEPIAEILAVSQFQSVQTQYAVGNEISEQAQSEIENIINDISTSESDPNKVEEIEKIRRVCNEGAIRRTRTVKVDLFIQEQSGAVHLFDLKTAKPNASNFKDFKRTLLQWVAIYLRQHPDAEVASYIAIPYNPYAPQPYERWTMRGMLDLNHELKVAEELWDFLGGNDVYEELLDCFESTGIALRTEIDNFFEKFKTTAE